MQKSRKKISNYVIVVFIAVFVILYSYSSCTSYGKTEEKTALKTSDACLSANDLKSSMRKLWEDHIIWTRNLLFCQVDNLPGKDEVLARLLQNQIDLGDALKPFYGEESGNQLTNLLYPHILISIEVVEAEKSGNLLKQEDAHTRWYANADEIALFISRLNPDWKLADMKIMMSNHLDLTENEACQRITKNYEADILAYDELHQKTLMMADMLSKGIINQFPEKFKKK